MNHRARYLAALRRYRPGDVIESTINGTRAVVEGVEWIEEFGRPRYRLHVRKVAHGWSEGWAKIGETYPESPGQCRRVGRVA